MRTRQFAALAVATVIAVSAATPSFAKSGFLPYVRPNVAVTYSLAMPISVILDAIYIAATQCREMTAQEAATAAFLPGVGGIYNATLPSQSKCKK